MADPNPLNLDSLFDSTPVPEPPKGTVKEQAKALAKELLHEAFLRYAVAPSLAGVVVALRFLWDGRGVDAVLIALAGALVSLIVSTCHWVIRRQAPAAP